MEKDSLDLLIEYNIPRSELESKHKNKYAIYGVTEDNQKFGLLWFDSKYWIALKKFENAHKYADKKDLKYYKSFILEVNQKFLKEIKNKYRSN